MPLVLGLASSHAPSMFAPADRWGDIHKALTRGVPQPPEIADETPEVIRSYVNRIAAGFAALRNKLMDRGVEVLVIVGDDQNEVFSKAVNPAIAVFTGERASGTTSVSFIGQKPDQNHVILENHSDIARQLVSGLMDLGFDPAVMEEVHALGKPLGGLGHAFTRIAKAMAATESNIKVIPLFVSGYHPPMPNGARCFELGIAIRRSLERRPEKIAIYGSGGLSHCPMGPRAGWVDVPLDMWLLDRIKRGEAEQLKALFNFDSDTLRGGTGEIRSWIVTAGAMNGTAGEVVDYIPARHAVTGLGFACWDLQS